MQFDDPVVGGQVLMRYGIQSADFSAGVSGWRILREGSAEFNDITARGDITASQLTVTDGVQNRVEIRSSAAYITINGSYLSGAITDTTIRPSSLVAANGYNGLVVNCGTLTISGTPHYGPQILMRTESADLSEIAHVDINNLDPSGTNTVELRVSGDITARGYPVPKTVAVGSSNVSSAAIGGADTEVLLTDSAVVFQANAAYRVDVVGGYTGSAIGSDPIWRVRKSDGAATGQLACFFRRTPVPTAAREYDLTLTQYFTVGAAVPASVKLAVCMSALAGTATYTGTFGGRSISVTYVGPSSLYPNANVLT